MLERDPESLPAPQRMSPSRRSRQREERSLALRRRLREAHRATFVDGGRRFTRPEVQALRRAIKRAMDHGDPVASLNDWINEYYPNHQRTVYRVMRPLVEALAAVVADAAFDEVSADPQDVSEFAHAYTENLARREVARSISELRSVMDETVADELDNALLARADEWEETRPDSFASREIVRVASGAARWAWQTAGVAGFIWRANADACPLCKELDGRRVPSKAYFLNDGDSVGSGTDTLIVEGPIGGPPLHDGCQCDWFLIDGGVTHEAGTTVIRTESGSRRRGEGQQVISAGVVYNKWEAGPAQNISSGPWLPEVKSHSTTTRTWCCHYRKHAAMQIRETRGIEYDCPFTTSTVGTG